ncbi:hypothetical protein ES707_03264 [subsurface metagenome]
MISQWSMLNIRVRDGVTKELIPARIHIKCPDGSCYIPPSEIEPTFDEKQTPQVILPMHFRKNLHLCQAANIQSAHLTRGEARFPVPAGKLSLYVSRGYERRPVSRIFVAKPDENVNVDVELETVESIRDIGWYSGDMHVHFSRFNLRDDLILASLMAAEDLCAVNNMVYKHHGEVQAPQRKMGHVGSHYQLQHHHQVVAGGEEFRDNDLYGHMIAAGISKIIEPISVGDTLGRRDSYPLFSQVCDWSHSQGGIAGWAHGGALIKLHESLPVEAALGKLDFVESVQFNCFLGFYFWYRLLNCGLPLAVTGGSDFPFDTDILAPWYPSLGRDRTYVQVGTEYRFSYDAYLAGIRRGRTFATNGPLLFFEVNGCGPGDTVDLENNERKIKLLARAVCQYPLERMEIVVNGAVQHIVESKGGQRELAFETYMCVSKSIWLAARVRGRVEPRAYGGAAPWNLHAHTSPIYVVKGGKPILEKADATAMADYIRLITERYRRIAHFKNNKHRKALFENLKQALVFYEGLLRLP